MFYSLICDLLGLLLFESSIIPSKQIWNMLYDFLTSIC